MPRPGARNGSNWMKMKTPGPRLAETYKQIWRTACLISAKGIQIQPFSQKSRTPTVAKECQIGLHDTSEADLALFWNSWSAGFLRERLYSRTVHVFLWSSTEESLNGTSARHAAFHRTVAAIHTACASELPTSFRTDAMATLLATRCPSTCAEYFQLHDHGTAALPSLCSHVTWPFFLERTGVVSDILTCFSLQRVLCSCSTLRILFVFLWTCMPATICLDALRPL